MPTSTAPAEADCVGVASAAEGERAVKVVEGVVAPMWVVRHCSGLASASEPYALPDHCRERPSLRSLTTCTIRLRLLVTRTVCSLERAVVPGARAGHV